MRRKLGMAVFVGMIGVTLFGIFLTPLFFFVINWLGEARLLSSPLLGRLEAVSLDDLRLGPLWRANGARGVRTNGAPAVRAEEAAAGPGPRTNGTPRSAAAETVETE